MAVKPAKGFVPYSTAIMKRTITCQTEEGKAFLGNNRMDNIAVALFILDVTSRKRIARLQLRTKDHKAATKALSKLFSDYETEITNETTRIETVLKAQKINGRAQHNNPKTQDVEITTPEMKRIIDLLEAFDNLMILTDTIWLMGIIETEVAITFKKQHAAKLKRLFGQVYTLSKAAKKSAYIKDDSEIQAAIAQEEDKYGITDETQNEPASPAASEEAAA